MELNLILEVVLIFVVGTAILRIGGRKSISQMTISQTIVMIGLGSLLIQPVSGRGLIITFLVGFILIGLMMITEYLGLKVDFLESIFTGKAVIIIEDGKPNIKNLRKLRLSIDKIETRLRQSGISSIEDVKYATIEVSGQLGYELKDNKKPLTKEDFIKLMNEMNQINLMSNNIENPKSNNNKSNNNKSNNIFEEINKDKFEGNKKEP